MGISGKVATPLTHTPHNTLYKLSTIVGNVFRPSKGFHYGDHNRSHHDDPLVGLCKGDSFNIHDIALVNGLGRHGGVHHYKNDLRPTDDRLDGFPPTHPRYTPSKCTW